MFFRSRNGMDTSPKGLLHPRCHLAIAWVTDAGVYLQRTGLLMWRDVFWLVNTYCLTYLQVSGCVLELVSKSKESDRGQSAPLTLGCRAVAGSF